MINPTPQCTSVYGAPMGRPAFGRYETPTSKFSVRRIHINSGGYDSGGAYWGTGQPLYWYYAESDTKEIKHRPHCSYGSRTDVHVATFCQECGEIERESFNEISDFIRADGREHAKSKVLAKYPQAKFYR